MPPSQRVQQQNQKIQEIISNTSDKAAQIRKIAPVRQWFRPEENDANYQTIQSLAQGSIDVNEASTRLFANIDPKVSDDFNFWDLWYGILLTARQLPLREEAEHTKLTSLLTAIKQHRNPNSDSHNHLYSNLTDFGPAVREAYNDTPEPDSAFEVEIESWASLNYFLALVTRDSIADFSIYAIWALREGLEVPYVDDEQGTAVQKYNTYVPAAVAWVLGMHRKLYEKEEDLTPPEGEKRNPAKGGELWKGKAEFSKQRWAFWKERLAAVAKDEKIAKRVQSLCADAVEDMERSETFQKGSS